MFENSRFGLGFLNIVKNMLFRYFTVAICLLGLLLLLPAKLPAQNFQSATVADTLRLGLTQIEKRFIDSNLQLLAQHYNIQSSKALVEQARKWDNPVLSTNQNLYNSQEGFFKHGTVTDAQGNTNPQGEIYADIEQLIRTAGKRKKQVEIAKTNSSLAEVQFDATMRSLRLTVITDFNTLVQLEGNATLFQENLDRLTGLVSAMQSQLAAGNIAKKEYLRIQALKIGIQQSITDNANSIEQTESELRSILRMHGNVYIKPVPVDPAHAVMPDLTIPALLDSAHHHNTDYRTEVYQLQLQQQNVKLQKAMAVPDVTVGVDMDQHSTYVPYYTGLNIGLPLPIWDRNRGNIKSAAALADAEYANLKQADIKLENDVLAAYRKLLAEVRLNSASNKQFYDDYYELFHNITDAFNKRQISMLEFLDYFNDYENTRQQQLQQIFNLQIARAELNDVVGIDIVK